MGYCCSKGNKAKSLEPFSENSKKQYITLANNKIENKEDQKEKNSTNHGEVNEIIKIKNSTSESSENNLG